MASGGGKPPKAPDPAQILALQNQYQHFNSNGPFGSQQWSSGGPGGHDTLTTSISPQMQGAMDRAFAASATPLQQQYIPQGVNQLTEGILGKVGSHYGLSGSGFNTNLQQQKPQAGMSPQQPHGMPQMGPMQGSGLMNPYQQAGTSSAGFGGMGGLMGAGQPGGMGFQSQLMNPILQALQGQAGQQNSGGNQLGGMPNLNYGGSNTMPLNRTLS